MESSTDLEDLAGQLDAKTGEDLLRLIGRLRASATSRTDPVRDVLGLIGDRWSTAILMILGTGTYRYVHLQRAIRLIRGETISQRMLTLKVRQLERNGLVSRKAIGTIPPRVDYALTELGRELLQNVWVLIGWLVSREDRIEEARRRWSAEDVKSIDC